MKAQFKLKDIVYLVTDTEQRPRMVTGVLERPGAWVYYLGCGAEETIHCEIEISPNKDWHAI